MAQKVIVFVEDGGYVEEAYSEDGTQLDVRVVDLSLTDGACPVCEAADQFGETCEACGVDAVNDDRADIVASIVEREGLSLDTPLYTVTVRDVVHFCQSRALQVGEDELAVLCKSLEDASFDWEAVLVDASQQLGLNRVDNFDPEEEI